MLICTRGIFFPDCCPQAKKPRKVNTMNTEYKNEIDASQVGAQEETVAPAYAARPETEAAYASSSIPAVQPVQPRAVPPYYGGVGVPARPEAPPPAAPAKPVKVKRGVPVVTALGFMFALLSLFFIPLFKEAMTNYLLYDGMPEEVLQYYHYAIWVLGGIVGLFAILGLILSPIGGSISKRRQREGRGLAVAGTMIALVALLFAGAVGVSLYLLSTQVGYF